MGKKHLSGDMKTYVEITYPGSFFHESEIKEVQQRNPQATAEANKGAFAFRYFDQARTEVELDGKTQTVFGERRNESPMYYPGGKLFTVDDIKELQPKKDYEILVSNMECNGYKQVVRTRRGNFQPFNEVHDEVL